MHVFISMPEQAVGWFPQGLELVVGLSDNGTN